MRKTGLQCPSPSSIAASSSFARRPHLRVRAPFLLFCRRNDGLLLIPILFGALSLAKEPSVSASESEEEDEEERSRKRHKRRRRSRSPADAEEDEDDSGKRHKRKHKHKRKHRKDSKDSPSRSGKVEPVGERKETEEEYDARLEREENERLAAERKRELEHLSRQHEQESPSTNGVRFKGTTLPPILTSPRILRHLHRTGKNEICRSGITQETIAIQSVFGHCSTFPLAFWSCRTYLTTTKHKVIS